ncbi:MAG TPA: hypothetical protein VGK32_14850 [Vicinamibacterales bacterium]
MRVLSTAASLALVLTLTAVDPAFADQRSEALRRQGYEAAYNLDHDRAVELFKQAIAADPNDAAAYRAAAAAAWLHVLFLRGTVTVDDYLGHISSTSDVQMPKPPADWDASFHQSVDRAVSLGEKEVLQHYRSASSHYDLGAGLGLVASYTGTIEGHIFAGLRAARRAFNESEMALELDPKRKDAGLVVGTYRYMVSTLPLPVRVMAYIVGFGGDRALGLKLIEEAAAYPSDIQTDARFALVLIYNREHRYDDALVVVRALERSYPRNRLLFLEDGSTALRGGRTQEAERILDEGIAGLQQDQRPKMPGEEGRWHYQRGMARLRLGKLPAAEEDLKLAMIRSEGRTWVQARIHVELGKLADLRGDRKAAVKAYELALSLGVASKDFRAETEARALLGTPYRQ